MSLYEIYEFVRDLLKKRKQLPKVEFPLPKEEPKPPVEEKPVTADQDEASHNFTHSAPITNKITYISHSGSGIRFRNSGLGWSDAELVGEAHLMVIRNGKWTGSKIDHVRNTTTSRDWKNVHGGYGKFGELGVPNAGEVCAFFLISYDKKKRTNAIFFDWK